MTMNVYAHVSLDNQRAGLDLLNAQLVDTDEDTSPTLRSAACRTLTRTDDTYSDLVGVTGFEPVAPRSQSECATKLRHTPWPAV
jgi:hypothetical protein